MTIERTVIKIDALSGISYRTSEVSPGDEFELEDIIIGDGPSAIKTMVVKSPDEVTFELFGDPDPDKVIPLGSLVKSEINTAKIEATETFQLKDPLRTVRQIDLYTWKPTKEGQ